MRISDATQWRHWAAVALTVCLASASMASAEKGPLPASSLTREDTAAVSLGPPIQGLPLNSAIAHRGLIYIFTMDVSPTRILVYDPEARELVRQIQFPPGSGNRTWATTVAGDTLYIGQDGVAGGRPNLFALDLADQESAPKPVAHVPPDGDFWALASDPDGILYAATRVERTLFRIDPSRPLGERVTPIPFSDESFRGTRHEVTALAWDDGLLLAGLRGRERGGSARLLQIDPADLDEGGVARTLDLTRWETGDHGALQGQGVYRIAIAGEQLLLGLQGSSNIPATFVRFVRETATQYNTTGRRPWKPVPAQITPFDGEGAITTFLTIDDPDSFLVAGNTTGTVYRVGPGGTSELAQPVVAAPIRALVGGSPRPVGVTSAAMVWQLSSADSDPEISFDDLIELGAPGDSPVRPHSIAQMGDWLVAGGNNILQAQNLSTGERERFTLSGEAKAMSTDGEAAYIVTYPKGQLWRYVPGGGPPELIADWPDIENRPWGIAWDERRGRALVTTQSDYRDFGTLYTIDPGLPANERIVREQRAVTGTDTPSRHGRAVGVAGDRILVGSNGNNPTLVSIDAKTGEAGPLTYPAPGLGNIQAIVGSPDGTRAHLLTAGGWWLVVDSMTGAVSRRQHVLPEGNAGDLAMRHGMLHAVSATRLVVVDPEDGTSRTVSTFPAALSHLNQKNVALFARDHAGCEVIVLAGSDLRRIHCGCLSASP
jgi:hypothetical protein